MMRIDSCVDTSWMVQVKCKEVGTEYFFPDYEGEWLDFDLAKSTCESCAFRAQCLDYAIFIRDDEGMWGGIEGDRRRKLRYKLNSTFPEYIDSLKSDIDYVACHLK